MSIPIRACAAVLAAAAVMSACSSAMQSSQSSSVGGGPAQTAVEGGPVAHPQPNVGDVKFMQGMIGHHAQAVLIAGWAPSHGASPELQRLCERIVVAQRDEIQLISNWLREKGQSVPPGDTVSARMPMSMGDMDMSMDMPGMAHDAMMPGMLSGAQLEALDAARGTDFDRLFLQDMIAHHEGAITMVEQLEQAYGARQDETVFRFSSDVYADQTTEIARMQKMLAALGSSI
jgi:uncharacterized protein (DUF305 family)